MKASKQAIYIGIIILLVLVSYINVFRNEFVWDDHIFIVENNKITSFSYIPYYFTHESMNSLWRPIRETLYIVTYKIWGLNAFGYHLNSLILHSLISLLVFLIISNIARNKEIALFSAILFAVHPIHTERVTNMTGAFDMLGLMFFLLGVYLFIKYREFGQKKHLYYSILFYVMALLSSEEVITFIGILILYDICFSANLKEFRIKDIKLIKEYAAYIIVSIVYVLLHFLIVQRVGRTLSYFEDSFYVTLLTSLKSVIYYIGLLIYPVNLTIYRTIPKATSILSINFMLSFAAMMIIGYIMVKCYKSKTISKLIFFSFGWFFITMFLFYNFIPKSTFMADRYLYFPSIGFCLLLGYLLYKVKDLMILGKKAAVLSIISLLIVAGAYTILTIKRNADWQNEEKLLTRTVEVSPLSTDANWALGAYYRKERDYDKAIYYLQKSIEISSKNYIAQEEIGVSYAELGQYDKAIDSIKRAIEIYPPELGGYYKAHNDLGLIYMRMGSLDEAIIELKKAISTNPEYAKAHNDIATVYARLGDYQSAEQEFKIAIQINPDEASYQKNLDALYALAEKNK